MLKRIFPLIALCICLFQEIGHAQAPKYSNEFLNLGVGGRGLGLGNSVVASTDDVFSGYWNPAGMVRMEDDFQLSYMHSEYFAGIAKYDYAGFAMRIDSLSTVGLTFIRFGVDDIPNTTQLIDANGQIDYDRITSFSAADYAFLLTYSRRLLGVEGFTYGANAKVVYRQVGDFAHAWGFGLDVGAQYHFKKWKFALMGRDLTSTFNAWDFTLDEETKKVWEQTGNEIPDNSLEVTLPKLLLGIGYKFELPKKFSIYPELNMDLTFDGKRSVLLPGDPISLDPHLGVEISYSDWVHLRGGFGNIQQYTDDDEGNKIYTWQPNIGIGFTAPAFKLGSIGIRGLSIDYAFTDIGDQSVALFSHVFSLNFGFGKM